MHWRERCVGFRLFPCFITRYQQHKLAHLGCCLEGVLLQHRSISEGQLLESCGAWFPGTVENDPVFAACYHDVSWVAVGLGHSHSGLSACQQSSRLWWYRVVRLALVGCPAWRSALQRPHLPSDKGGEVEGTFACPRPKSRRQYPKWTASLRPRVCPIK